MEKWNKCKLVIEFIIKVGKVAISLLDSIKDVFKKK